MAATKGSTRKKTARKKATKAKPRKAASGARPKARPPRRTLRLHRSIYPTRAVSETVVAFSELATAQVTSDGEYHRVQLVAAPDVDPEQLVHEFANFALSRSARNR